MPANAVLVNFAGGETSPKSRGRFDQPWYATAARKILNLIVEVMGPARFRPGFKHIRQTRRGQIARQFTFQISNNRSFELEFTPGFLRVYKNDDLITTTERSITAITNASTAVITLTSAAGYANGNEIIITGVVGMPEINNRQVKLANGVGLTFQLVDPVTDAGINSTAFGTYTSGGTAKLVYEIASPYFAGDLPSLQVAQSNTTMYLVTPTVVPYKLTVDSGDAFTLATFVRTNDPFNAFSPSLTVIEVVRSGTLSVTPPIIGVPPGTTLVGFAAGTVIEPDVKYTFSGVVGTTQINGGTYFLLPVAIPGQINPWAFLETVPARAQVDSSGWTLYVSGGVAASPAENPIAVAFYEGRLGYFGTNQRPNCFFLSRSPDSDGNERYDDFTGGTDADNACFFQLAPVSGSVDYISWARGSPDYLFIGSFGGPYRVSGAGLDTPITPTSINVRQFDTAGCEETMAAGCAQVFFIQRGGTALRSIKVVNPYLSTFESEDMALNADQVMSSPLQRVILQEGRPDIMWVTREDGILCGLTVKITNVAAESIAGWHRHKLGGVNAKVLDFAVQQRITGLDRLWVHTERVVNGITRRYFEVLNDDVVYPDPEDFFTSILATDLTAFRNALYRLQERYIHVDSSLTYNGSDRGATAGATLTPGALTGTGITFTASQPVFVAGDVGSELWKKPNQFTGVGSGRAVITGFTSSTVVTATVQVDFDAVTAVPAGDWYFAVQNIYGLAPLDGSEVAVVTDGAVLTDGGQTDDPDYITVTVANGKIALANAAAVVHVGLPYIGMLVTHNLEVGGRSGPAQDKPREISEMDIRFMNSLGVEYGTDLYNLDKIEHRLSNATMDRPAPVFSGIRRLSYADTSSGLDDANREKKVVVMQRLPLPAIIQFIDLHYDATDEG